MRGDRSEMVGGEGSRDKDVHAVCIPLSLGVNISYIYWELCTHQLSANSEDSLDKHMNHLFVDYEGLCFFN